MGTKKDKGKEKRCKRKHLTYSISLNRNNNEINTSKQRMKKVRKQNGAQSVWRHTEKFHSWFSLELLIVVVDVDADAVAAAAAATDWGIKRKRARDQKGMDNMHVCVCLLPVYKQIRKIHNTYIYIVQIHLAIVRVY